MGRLYVTDLLGEEYKKWQPGDWVLLSYPTGMGKTHFILHTLLRDAASHGGHLVYYCNRKFLSLQFEAIVKQQLLEELGEEGEALRQYLHVRTYQNAELTRSYPNLYHYGKNRDYHGDVELEQWQVTYYVFDEAQYAVADSQVNPHTDFWLSHMDRLKDRFHIHVFLTGTPEPFQLFYSCLSDNLTVELMQTFLSRYCIDRIDSQGGSPDYWFRYASDRYQYLSAQYDQANAQVRLYWNYYSTQQTPFNWHQYEKSRLIHGNIELQLDTERARILELSRNPFRILYDFVDMSYRLFPTRHYQLDTPLRELYSYVDERYFDDLIEMAGRIAVSAARGERWLIFVRKKEDGELLQTFLESHGCRSVTVTARTAKNYDGRKVPRRSPRNRALEALVWRQELGCNVLISTSVLDNGISLHADAVDHLVLCQPGKTSFLQMLGRVRVREGQKLKVYIQRQKPKEIKGYIDQCRKDILFLIRWELNRSQTLRDPFYPHVSDTHIPPIIHQTEELEQERQEYEYRTKYLIKEKGGVEKANLLVLCQLLGNLYDMEVRARSHGDQDGNYYLRHQLSWLGKEYDPTRWIDYQETVDALTQHLEELAQSKKRLFKEDQMTFRQNCLRLLTELRHPSPYFDKVRARFSLEREEYPGLRALNLAFEDARIPYRIRNKQAAKTKQDPSRETYWYIEKIPVAKESEHPLQDAPKLTDSQDTSDGSCLSSAGTPAG